MKRSLYAPSTMVALTLTFAADTALAQAVEADNTLLETLTVIGKRQAYRCDFDLLEIPQAELRID